MSGLKENSTKSSQDEIPLAKEKSSSRYWFLTLTVLLVIIAYQPVLFDFFLGDDFVHLIWLKQAMQNPELILRNFSHNWLDITTTSFYRPLISVFMASDYFFWGVNGLGFHITNLVFHLIATIAIYFIAAGIFEDVFEARGNKESFGLIAALIFGLYPLHCEAVSWITGRVDAVVTAFICLAVMFFRYWRTQKKTIYFAATIVTMTLALLSKEMGITLPAMFFAYSFFLEKRKDSISFLNRFGKSLKVTAPFFILLAAYFVLRRFALGTFVGGYDDSLLPLANLRHFFETWIHAIRMCLIPLNREVVSSSNPLTMVWISVLSLTALAYCYNLFKLNGTAKLSLFTGSLLVFALLPVYKLFAIANDLQGSRLAHVATVAMALILATAFISQNSENKFTRYGKHILAAVYIILCFTGLRINNSVWADAGKQVNSIRTSLAGQYESISGDPQVLLLNLPDNFKGAYACRNALDGITKSPQFPRDINNCLQVSNYEPIVPIGFLKDSILENSNKIKILSWNQTRFINLQLNPNLNENARKSWNSLELANLSKKTDRPKSVLLNFEKEKISNPDFDFLALEFDNAGKSVVVEFTTLLNKNRSRENSLVADYAAGKTVYFSLSSRPAWLFGGSIQELLISSSVSPKLKSLSFIKKDALIPKLDFENSGFLGSKGYLHLDNAKKSEAKVSIDSTAVKRASKTLLTITKPNKFFKVLNSDSMQDELLVKIPTPLNGEFTLKRSLFPSDGIYELRCWCLDAQDSPIGFASDHIVISIDN